MFSPSGLLLASLAADVVAAALGILFIYSERTVATPTGSTNSMRSKAPNL
jgi:hypothetical protein